jgi:hypothetical protein
MGIWNFTKHTAAAGAAGMATKPLEDRLRASNLSDEEKAKYVGATVGAAVGAAAGYYVGERVGDHSGTYTTKEKVMSAAVGALGGALSGYVIGSLISGGRIVAPKNTSQLP